MSLVESSSVAFPAAANAAKSGAKTRSIATWRLTLDENWSGNWGK